MFHSAQLTNIKRNDISIEVSNECFIRVVMIHDNVIEEH